MASRAQGIRPSQFITTYGPGALLEGVGGPRVINSLDESDLFGNAQVTQFEILEPALQQVLTGGARIFRLPTNADLRRAERESIYTTRPFPRWSLCVRHGVVYQHKMPSHQTCPECPKHTDKFDAYHAARLEAISLAMACPEGHLCDVDWLGLVHRGTTCNSKVLQWEGQGSSLSHVNIHCKKCSQSINLGQEYLRDHHCPGFWAEKDQRDRCQSKARIVQRGASNLFVPEVLSSISVPRVSSPVLRALTHTTIINTLNAYRDDEGQLQVARFRKGLATFTDVPKEVGDILNRASDEELLEGAQAANEQSTELSPDQARQLEFRELKKAVQKGLKHHASTAPAWASTEFEVDPALARNIDFGPFLLRVTPVLRLRVVSVQTGYRRLGGKLVSSAYAPGNTLWYPGVELLGEGIFVDFARQPHTPTGPAWEWWAAQYQQSQVPHQHPGFVWWHTLSHRLVRALAVHSGYSSASVRERIYSVSQEGAWDGGLLLYAVQPGGDGTLGGLIALVSRFERILQEARDYLDNCSNDPFCSDVPRRPSLGSEQASGPACYACSLLSETSCEHRNSSLDRILLLDSL